MRSPQRRQVAEQIVAAEDALASSRTPDDVLADAGHLQQLAYRELGSHPGWDARVRDVVPRRLHGLVRDNVASRREFRSEASEPTGRPQRRAAGLADRGAGTAPSLLALLPGGRATGSASPGSPRRDRPARRPWVGSGVSRAPAPRARCSSCPPLGAYGMGGDITDPATRSWRPLATWRRTASPGTDERPGALYRNNDSTAYVRGVRYWPR